MKKLFSILLTVGIIGYSGYYFTQGVFGNTDGMMDYLEETETLTLDYFSLVDGQYSFETDEELLEYSEQVLIPGLEEILSRSEAIGDAITKEKLKEVHELHNRSIDIHLQAEKAWLAEQESDHLFEEADALYVQYEEELDSLAKKWGVEIEWIED